MRLSSAVTRAQRAGDLGLATSDIFFCRRSGVHRGPRCRVRRQVFSGKQTSQLLRERKASVPWVVSGKMIYAY
jgi:hypothetical protein